MRKIILNSYGEAQVLKVTEHPDSEVGALGPDQVLVKVAYSGLNFADVIMRMGFYQDAPPRPFVPGYEVSGTVVEVGQEVKHLGPGDNVYCGTFFGGYASLVRVPGWQVMKIPSHLDLSQAAGLPVTFITAYNSFLRMGRVQNGDRVLIDCATGGVGTMAISLLKGLDVDIVGLTSSTNKLDFLKSLGIRGLTHQQFWQSTSKEDQQFDFILNSQGGSTIRKHFQRLGPTGRMVCLGISDGINTKWPRSLSFLPVLKTVIQMPRFSVLELFNCNKGIFALNALHLMANTEWIKKRMSDFAIVEQKKCVPTIGKIFKAEDIASAHQFMERKQAIGKVLIQWNA